MTREDREPARILSANRIMDEILRVLSKEYKTVKEIAEEVRCSEGEAARAVKLLVTIGLVVFEKEKARLDPTVEDLLEEIC